MQRNKDTLKTWQFVIWWIVIFALTAFGFIYFWYYLYQLLQGLITEAADITVNKGAFYCLGGAFLGVILLYFGINKLRGKTVSKAQNAWASRAFFVALGLIILLPQLIHYPTASYLQAQGYSECALQSRQWLHDKVMVFTVTPEHCIEMARADCEEAPDRQKCRLLPQFSTNKTVTD
jgi:magnesium-transporting ATPase (P-type)